jgi:hypothetical protein
VFSPFIRPLAALGIAACLVSAAPGAMAAPAAVDILFEAPHLSNLQPDTEVLYKFERKSSDAKVTGEGFTDEIRLKVTGTESDGSRDVDLRVFSGERAREIGAIPGLNGNPVLVSFLDRAVLNMVQLAGGNNMYFKNRLRDALLNKATVETVTVDFDGKPIELSKITVVPFADDPNAAKMLGYEGSRFEMMAGDAVPGGLYALKAHYESPISGAPQLEEVITLDKVVPKS